MAKLDPEVGQRILPMPERASQSAARSITLRSRRREKGKVNQVKVTRQDSFASVYPVGAYVARVCGLKGLLHDFFFFRSFLAFQRVLSTLPNIALRQFMNYSSCRYPNIVSSF